MNPRNRQLIALERRQGLEKRMFRLHRATYIVATMALAVACSEQPAERAATFTLDTLPSGVVQVTNIGIAASVDQGAWGLEEDLRLGTVGGGGAEQFSQIAGVREDRDGRIFILDYSDQEIRVFDPSGEFSHVIGGKGEGPGELAGAAGIDFAPDGDLWVWDPSNGRYSVFRPSGEFVTSYRRKVMAVVFPWLGGFIADGSYVDWGLARPGDDPSRGIIGSRSIYYPVRFTPPEQYDTLPPLEYEREMASNGQPKPLGSGFTFVQSRTGRLLFAEASEYTIYERGLGGDTLRIFSMPSRPMLVTKEERDSIVEQRANIGSRFAIERSDVPTQKRIVRRIFTDGAHYIYVIVQEEGVPEGTAFDVFRDDGVFLDRVEFPRPIEFSYPPPYVTQEHIYVIEHDEFDVPYVVRFRILRPKP